MVYVIRGVGLRTVAAITETRYEVRTSNLNTANRRMIVSGHSGNTVASVETVKALPKQRSFMLSWTRFVLVLVALEGAHACLYLNPPTASHAHQS